MTIASSGYGKRLLQWLDVLSGEQKRDPRVQLVAAFTQAGLGKVSRRAGSCRGSRLPQSRPVSVRPARS